MKNTVYLILILGLIACNGPESEPSKNVATDSSTVSKDTKISTPVTDLSGPVKATIDMGTYIFRVHEIVQYHPSQLQAEMLKLDDTKSDFYVLNCSVESKSDTPIDLGQINIAAYFTLSNGTSFDKILRGGFILGGFGNDNDSRYNKDEYDKIWSNTFPAKGKARTDMYGIETPGGVKVTGVGFYETNKKQNKYSSFVD